MPNILIRNLSQETVDALKRRAKRHGRSLQQEAAMAVEKVAAEIDTDYVAEAHRIREELRASGRTFSDSTELIREARDTR